jgi:hypothetical protein
MLLNLDGTDEQNKGIAKIWTNALQTGTSLWHGIVVTLNVSPDTLFGVPFEAEGWPGFDFDTMGDLTVASDFTDWSLSVHRTKLLIK